MQVIGVEGDDHQGTVHMHPFTAKTTSVALKGIKVGCCLGTLVLVAVRCCELLKQLFCFLL